MNLRGLILAAFLVFPLLAQASGGEHGVPWGLIQKQTISFVIVVAILYWLLNKQVVAFFQGRAVSFEKLLVVARKAREEADQQKNQIVGKLHKLESTSKESLDQALEEAEKIKNKVKAEAELASKQIREEAEKSAQREIERATADLRREALSLAMNQTRENMRTSVAEPDQTRLQNEFVEKIQVVR